MRAILNPAALYLAQEDTTQRRRELFRLAMQYHTEALQGLNERINNLNEKVADAVCATAFANSIHVFCLYGPLGQSIDADASMGAHYRRILGTD